MLYLKQNALCVQLVLLKIIDLVSWGKTLLRGCEKEWRLLVWFHTSIPLKAVCWRVFLCCLLIFLWKKGGGGWNEVLLLLFSHASCSCAVSPGAWGSRRSQRQRRDSSELHFYIQSSTRLPKFRSLDLDFQSIWSPAPAEAIHTAGETFARM